MRNISSRSSRDDYGARLNLSAVGQMQSKRSLDANETFDLGWNGKLDTEFLRLHDAYLTATAMSVASNPEPIQLGLSVALDVLSDFIFFSRDLCDARAGGFDRERANRNGA